MIPQGFIQDLLARVDIVDVVGRYVQLKKAGQNHLGLCPFHGEKTPSFTVSESKQFYHCFGCGAHGSAIGFLMDQRGLSYVEAIHELAQQAGLTVPETVRADSEQAHRSRGLTELLGVAAEFYRRELKTSTLAIDYLKGRAITGQTAARFALGYAPDAWQSLRAAVPSYEDPRLAEAGLVIVGDEGKRYDRFRGRVMFPIRNRRGAVIGFGARVLCEGYMDVIQLAQAGFGESVAALGTAVTAHHVTTLLRLVDHVIFAFDGDAAGRKAARRALEAALPAISDTKRASFVLLPQGEDPDSLIKAHGAGAFEDELRRALPLSRWFSRSLADGRDLEQAEDRAALLAEAQPLLDSMVPSALRLQLTRELATAARTAVEDIEALFGLKKWRRLPEARAEAGKAGRAPAVEAGDLKARILRHLVAFPELAREFNAQIAAESLESAAQVDRQIAEVWRAATGGAGSSSGALLEALADSEFAASYREVAARGMSMADDPIAAREDLAAAFTALELRRIEVELGRLVQGELTDEVKVRIRELSDHRIRLKDASRCGADAASH